MKDFKKNITEYFDENYSFWVDHHRRSIRLEYLELLGDVYNKKVLDMGCGIGLDAEILAVQGATGVGIDISGSSIEFCKSKSLEGWDFIQADSEKLNIDKQFDVVISSMEMMYHENFNRILKKYFDYLQPSGKFLLVINNPFLISMEYNLQYSMETDYQHHFNKDGFNVPKFHRPVQRYLDAAETCGIKLLICREITCSNNDCISFNLKNPLGMPEFSAFLFEK